MTPQYFIVSSGRTATHFFAHYLNASGLRSAVHQPEPDPAAMPIRATTREIANGFVRGTYDFEQVSDWLAARPLGVEVEVNPHLFSLVGPARRAYPHGKFIYIVRDPWGFCQSGYRFCLPPYGAFTKPVQYFVDEAHEQRLCAPQIPGEEKYAALWPRLSRAEKIAWFWRIRNMRLTAALPPEAPLLRFEDIVRPPYTGMQQLLRALDCNVPVDAELMADARSASDPKAERIPDSERGRLLEIAFDWDWWADPRLVALFAPYLDSNATPQQAVAAAGATMVGGS